MSPEVMGALVGVGGTLFLGLVGYAIKGFVGVVGNGKTPHCLDHYHIVETVAEVRTDVKWIREQMELGGEVVPEQNM